MNNAQARPPLLVGHLPVRRRDLLLAPVAAGFAAGAGLAGIELSRTMLVTSAESCPMCACCAVWAGLKGAAFGTSIATLIRYGWGQVDIPQREVVAHSTFSSMPVVGGILAVETDLLYRDGQPR